MRLFTLTGLLFFLLISCGGDESDFDFSDNSKENVCEIGPTKHSKCDPSIWNSEYDSAEDYISFYVEDCVKNWNENIADGEAHDTAECQSAWLKNNECMYNLSCDVYLTTLRCYDEQNVSDDICLCHEELNAAIQACYH